MNELTVRQQQFVDAVAHLTKLNGERPTLDQLAHRMHVSRQTVRMTLLAIEKKTGTVLHHVGRKRRAICPTCGGTGTVGDEGAG